MFKTYKKSAKLTTVLALAMVMCLMLTSNVFALNQNGTGSPGTGNKPLDFNGYQYASTTSIKLFFDKSISSSQIATGDFTVVPHSGGSNLVSNYALSTGTGYSGINSGTNLDKGSTVTLTLSTLSYNTLYDVTVKGATLADGDGMTFANYRNRSNFTFTFLTPESDGVTYDNTKPLNITYSVGTSNVPYENNLVVVFDRPFSTNSTTLSNFISSLSSNYTKGGTTVTQDTNYSRAKATPLSGAECYSPVSNSASGNNAFIFPETVNTDSYAIYNRDSSGSHSYTLTLPTFTDVNGHTFSNPGSITFSTVSGDLPGFLKAPTVTADANPGQLDVTWSASSFTGSATSYDVYYIDSTTGDPLTGQYSVPINTTSTSYNITGLTSGDLYYVRIVPKNSYGEAGYSLTGSGTPNY